MRGWDSNPNQFFVPREGTLTPWLGTSGKGGGNKKPDVTLMIRFSRHGRAPVPKQARINTCTIKGAWTITRHPDEDSGYSHGG